MYIKLAADVPVGAAGKEKARRNSMPRKLKTYTTSAGFFDLAIAAPSMKAALEAWGSTNNLFHQGFAQVSNDPAIVAATMAKPGVVLRRPVGSADAFSEHAELPRDLGMGKVQRTPAKRSARPKQTMAKVFDDKTVRRAAVAFERQQKRRQRESRREEAARAEQRQRRDRATAAAEEALENAERDHQITVGDLEKQRGKLDRKLEAENARWKKRRERLETALRDARRYVRLR